jgi:hypothetical protein
LDADFVASKSASTTYTPVPILDQTPGPIGTLSYHFV